MSKSTDMFMDAQEIESASREQMLAKIYDKMECEECASKGLVEIDPRDNLTTDGQESEINYHQENNEICLSCDTCGYWNWLHPKKMCLINLKTYCKEDFPKVKWEEDPSGYEYVRMDELAELSGLRNNKKTKIIGRSKKHIFWLKDYDIGMPNEKDCYGDIDKFRGYPCEAVRFITTLKFSCPFCKNGALIHYRGKYGDESQCDNCSATTDDAELASRFNYPTITKQVRLSRLKTFNQKDYLDYKWYDDPTKYAYVRKGWNDMGKKPNGFDKKSGWKLIGYGKKYFFRLKEYDMGMPKEMDVYGKKNSYLPTGAVRFVVEEQTEEKDSTEIINKTEDKWTPEQIENIKHSEAQLNKKENPTIYLAGKVNGKKWIIKDRIKNAHFISSDGGNHSAHDWGIAQCDFNNDTARKQLKDACLDKIDKSDFLIAWLDTACSYGSIAEIAYASTIGKKCFIFVDCNSPLIERKDNVIEFNSLYDAYWFVSHFPNVETLSLPFEKTVEVVQKLINCSQKFKSKEFIFSSKDILDKIIQEEDEFIKTLNPSEQEDFSQLKDRQPLSKTIVYFKRNKEIVKQLKKLYKNKCQICDFTFQKDNGENYSETHHVIPLGENGSDEIKNLIVVCPNCHKQLHYAKNHKYNIKYNEKHYELIKKDLKELTK